MGSVRQTMLQRSATGRSGHIDGERSNLMNQSKQRRTPGRPEGFDRSEVVSRAVGAFWKDGYDSTSLAKISAATGIERSTLYNSFGGKAGLYQSAANQYVANVENELFAPLFDGTAEDLSDIVEFFDRLEHSTRSDEFPRGCFIVNDLRSTGRDIDATNRYLDRLTDGLRSAFERAGTLGEELERRIRTLSAGIVGVNAVAQHDPDAAISMLDGLRHTLCGWQGTE